jgi:hypothetical protein
LLARAFDIARQPDERGGDRHNQHRATRDAHEAAEDAAPRRIRRRLLLRRTQPRPYRNDRVVVLWKIRCHSIARIQL